jgi:hypothetical protein
VKPGTEKKPLMPRCVGGEAETTFWRRFRRTALNYSQATSATFGTIAAARDFVLARIATLPADARVLDEVPLPSGISASISALLPEPIYIPAVKNLSDDLKTSQSTSFGRLIGLLLEDLAPDLAQINTSLEQLHALLNRRTQGGLVQDERHRKVIELEGLIQGFLQQNFPRALVELVVPPPELRTIFNTAQIYVDDGTRDLIDHKGDGIKRSLTFSVLRTYVHQLEARALTGPGEQGRAPRPLIFLFEEPELYLHPRSQRVLFGTLAEISQSHPVIVTTHSPLFFAPGITASFVRVAKRDAAPKPVTELFQVRFDLEAAHSSTFQLARFEHADAGFFSRRVVLFEGESDDAFCKHAARLLNPGWDFEAQNISLIRVSGKGNFRKFRTFFESFEIEVKVVADLDALFEGFGHLGAPEGCDAIRQQVLQSVDRRIAALGVVAEPALRQIKSKVHQESWRARYFAAKEVVRNVQTSGTISPEEVERLDGLFTWETDIARVRACKEDAAARNALVPLLDALRTAGICVLSQGAIEDYYPDETPSCGSKPERALRATELTTNSAHAASLSRPLEAGRPTELEEVFAELFR